MGIRQAALTWLAAHGGAEGGWVGCSKLYEPEHSWTGRRAWWLQVPLEMIETRETVHLLCESPERGRRFRHLAVPTSVFREHLADFATIHESHVVLFLSAEPDNELQDERGPGRVSFASFERR